MENVDQDKIEIVTLPVSSWQEYKELRLRALKTDPQAFASSYQKEVAYPDTKWQERLQGAMDGKSWIFFARLNGKIAGMTGAYRDENDIKNHQVWIWGVYVNSEARRKGLAKSLMAKMLEELKKREDIDTVKVGVNLDQEPAKKLYEKFGFKPVETELLVLGDGLEHEESIMELIL